MPSLPIPMISALVLSFLFVNITRSERPNKALALLLFTCALQGLIISLAQHYEVAVFKLVQPVTATFIPPLTWVAFQTTAIRRIRKHDLLHTVGPLLALAFLTFAPYLLDVLIPMVFLGYGITILGTTRFGSNALPNMRLEAGDLPMRIWLAMAAALIGSAFSDVLIVVAINLNAAFLQVWIISLYSSLSLLLIGGLSVSRALATDTIPIEEITEPEISSHDLHIMELLEEHMRQSKPYLNPDLTLAQLSRKILVPAKPLSSAINRVTGENVSRYINLARIKAAQAALIQGVSITTTTYESGFNTKSNFNREFLRITGKSPSDWLDAQKAEVKKPPSPA
ncbi:MAG: helix-turn-helix domain-containing protein [Alphaproteobacteria bacterium]